MTDRPRHSLRSGEVTRLGAHDHDHDHDQDHDQDQDHGHDDLDSRFSARLSEVVRHAQRLARRPTHDAIERLGRERLLAAAMLKARPVAGASHMFQSRRLWARTRPSTAWVALGVLTALALGGYRLLKPAPVALSLSAPPALEAPLTYRTQGGQPSAPNYLVAQAHASASLRFSDGSEVTAAPGTRLRVDSTRSRGARVILEEGEARAHVTHRDHASWVFVAGPFDVRITGTTFTLSWRATEQVLDLTLHDGSVEVDSPLGASRVKVQTGQRFHASVSDGTMQLLAAEDTLPEQARQAARQGADVAQKPGRHAVRDQRARDAHGASRSQRRAGLHAARARTRRDSSADRDEAAPVASTGAGAAASALASFADLVRAGAFEQVIEAANRAGLGQTLERASADDVRALADAARYLHRTELAVRSLTVLRARFPGNHQSAAAAFLLGRTYEDAEQPAAARRFYELYERESPQGEFAAEALAGRMRTVAELEGRSACRELAQRYLARYPRGVHANTARRLLRGE